MTRKFQAVLIAFLLLLSAFQPAFALDTGNSQRELNNIRS